MNKIIPLLVAAAVLLFIIILMRRTPAETESDRSPKLIATSSKATPSVSPPLVPAPLVNSDGAPVGSPGSERVRVPSPFLKRSAEDFPHNLDAFADWSSLSADELRIYRASLISRVGRWDAEKVSRFFFKADAQFTDPAAKTEFRNAILGVWCAKGVESCLSGLEETLPAQDAVGAKREAMAGWAREDWLTALRYLQSNGDNQIEARLGGDSTQFVATVVREVNAAHGIEEARGLLSQITQENNRAAAQEQLDALQNVESPATKEN
jgi:hypothetical protein